MNDLWSGKLKPCTDTICAKRDDLIHIGMFDETLTHGEDIDCWWRMMLYKGAVLDSRPMANYRQDTENRVTYASVPLERFILSAIDKYKDARTQNKAFRRFFDFQMSLRLPPYMQSRKYAKQARYIARQLDYSIQPKSVFFKVWMPRLYNLYSLIKKKL